MKRHALKIYASVFALLFSAMILVACPSGDAQSAAVAVNKYANALSSFQDVEIQLHQDKKADGTPLISDDIHRTILEKEKLAKAAGHNLDTAIGIAAKGGDVSQYIDLANQSFNDLLDNLKVGDDQTEQSLRTAVLLASDALKNAITLINQVKAKAASPVTQHPIPVSVLWAMFLPLLALSGVTVGGILQLLQIAASLEPYAFDFVVKIADSMKGKSIEEVLAMNEAIFNKIDATADAELAKLPPKS